MYNLDKNLFVLIFFIISSIGYSKNIREEAVAGIWYPKSANELEDKVNEFLNKIPDIKIDGEVLGIILPHAGYIFSGEVLAYGYKILKEKKIDTAIIIGPSHYTSFKGAAIYNKGAFKTPLGCINIDEELATKIINAEPLIRSNLSVHQKEHSIEVQLPFLQKISKHIKIVPILIGDSSRDTCERLANAIVSTTKGLNTILIASTDLSHYYSYEKACNLDKQTISTICSLDTDKIVYCELCGLMPVLTLMLIAQKKEVKKVELLKYQNSGDIEEGDKTRVVGYASIAFHNGVLQTKEKEELNLTSEEQQELLSISRKTLVDYIKYKKRSEFTIKSSNLQKESGVFVTLTKYGNLRGCIGQVVPLDPLYIATREMTIAVATQDVRFPVVLPEEIERIKIEISVIGNLQRIKNINEIEVGKHGLFIKKPVKKRIFSGLLLPQVASKYKWTKEEFLKQVCRKAGLQDDDWKKNAEIYIFTAQIIKEK